MQEIYLQWDSSRRRRQLQRRSRIRQDGSVHAALWQTGISARYAARQSLYQTSGDVHAELLIRGISVRIAVQRDRKMNIEGIYNG